VALELTPQMTSLVGKLWENGEQSMHYNGLWWIYGNFWVPYFHTNPFLRGQEFHMLEQWRLLGP
jgi:hypothetical protein